MASESGGSHDPARQSRRAFLTLIILGGGGSLLAACQQPAAAPAPAATAAPPKPTAAPTTAPTAVPAVATPAVAAKPAAVDMATIEAAAKKEGKVVVYSSFNLDEFNQVYPLFEKRYPGITVDHVRGNGEQLVQRLITETKGGKVLADVLETNSFDVFNVLNEQLFEPFAAPNAIVFPDNLKDKDNLWVSTRQNIDVIAWNTDLVKPDEAPKSYDDLADPKWSGKIMVEATDMEMFAGLVGGKFGDLNKATEWLRKVGANKPQAFKGHTETTELLAAGQSPLFFGAYAHRIEALKLKQAPIDWMKTEATQLLQAGGVIKGAPNPNAARLFWNWLLSEEGQQAISDIGRVPSRPGVKLQAPLKPEGIKMYPARPEMAKDYQQLTKVWNEALGINA